MRDLKAIVDGLAAGKAKAAPGYDGKDTRRIESSVVLGAHKDGVSTVELEMSVSHHKESKCYVARLNISSVKDEGVFTSRSYSLFDKETSGQLDRFESPRYSAKALDAFWELQIGKLQDDPSILSALNLDHNQEVAA
jgi:hypothetical protein